MSDVQTLLARCQELGATLTPSPDGKLKVRAPAPLPEELQAELRRRKGEVLALLTQQPSPPSSGVSPQQPGKKDILTPWGWLSRLSDEDKARWEKRNSVQSSPEVPPWPCPSCSGAVRLDLPDEHIPSRFWTCSGCGAWGATRDGAAYPVVWIGRATVQ